MSLHEKTIAFIGGGNMARAMVSGLIQKGISPQHIWVTGRDAEKLARFREQFGVQVTTDNTQAIMACDLAVLCVKPFQTAQVCREIQAACAAKRVLVISVITGVTLSLFARWLGESVPVVRSMPNTPSQLGFGVTGVAANTHVSEAQQALADELLATLGTTYRFTQESDLDSVTALTGSGPAYVLFFMEALQAAAISAGLDAACAARMLQEMVIGTAEMALQSDLTMAQLRHQITSKGGTTEQALLALTEGDFSSLLAKAFQRARARASDITHQLQEE